LRVLIVAYGNYENEETWIFNTDEPLEIDWHTFKKEHPKTKLHEYLESMGGTLVGFDELIL
jgi:hypothetical protein